MEVFIVEKPSDPLKNAEWLLEPAVPLLSFGGAAVALLAQMYNVPLDIRYPAFGCVAASLILAYLALLRPRKDIVAISTPIYAIIFFIVPSDSSAGILLLLLYAASLTILLVRLKRRFGSGRSGEEREDGPLFDYVTRIGETMACIPSDTAADAGRIFIRFAHGEYGMAAGLAQTYLSRKENEGDNALATAFAIIAGHDAQCSSAPAPISRLHHFTGEESALLFHPASESTDTEEEYSVALDNALLLCYAVAIAFAGEEQREQVRSFHPFAEKLASLK
ncbi:MAG: hypothetical protein CVV32_12915 [Methanomicrobiales archaeon HGW-Methanomicrobiales-3]|nr:MAG: hypothetical protein CVV32_12915 [Methanomicrobiales archaeon HGW-Methanomicrobiales-3]